MWKFKTDSEIKYGLIVQIFPNDNSIKLPEYTSYLDNVMNLRGILKDAWKIYDVKCDVKSNEEDFSLCVYRKRVIFYCKSSINRIDCTNLDKAIRFVLNESETWENKVKALFPDDVTLKSIPFFFTDNISFKNGDLIGEGITSFNYRLHNAMSGSPGILRISRHILVCCGLNNFLLQEAINSCYEKLLINNLPEISEEDVFEFMESMNRFAVSSEENSFFQVLALKITVIFSLFTSVAGIVDYFCIPFYIKIIIRIALIILIYPAYLLSNKLMYLIEKLKERKS